MSMTARKQHYMTVALLIEEVSRGVVNVLEQSMIELH